MTRKLHKLRKATGIVTGFAVGVVLYAGFAIYWPGAAEAMGWWNPEVLAVVSAHILLAVLIFFCGAAVTPDDWKGVLQNVR